MNDRRQSAGTPAPQPPPPAWRSKLAGAALAALMLAAGACSLIVQHKTNQCESDAECDRFGSHPTCQEGVCVASGLGPPGCFYGDAGTQEQIQNQCTAAQCLKFDNCERLHLCDGAELPALVDPPGPSK